MTDQQHESVDDAAQSRLEAETPADDEQRETPDAPAAHSDEAAQADEVIQSDESAQAPEADDAVDAAEQQEPEGEPTPARRPPSGPIEELEVASADEIPPRDWYILKVQSNREDSIRDGLLRRIKIAGLEDYFGDIIVPTEKVTEFRAGKKRVVKRKLYPGYIVVHMSLNDDTWFLVRETPGIGDFTGAGGKPSPMLPSEVSRIVQTAEEKTDEQPRLKISFAVGDRVKINDGTFENFEGEVDSIDQANGRVTVLTNIFGRSTPVELEYWQIESL